MLTNYDEYHDFFERSQILSADDFGNQYIKTIRLYPEANWKDAFSRGQLRSKQWLVENLKNTHNNLGTVYLCAGWYGTLSYLLFLNNFTIHKIRSFDIDESCWKIAETLNKKYVMQNWKFKASTQDIHSLEYPGHYVTKRSNGTECELFDDPDTIINTSCEHIVNFREWYDKIPTGKIVILQSNNYYDINDHVNCYDSVDNFVKDCPMSSLDFAGELDCGSYNRFMLIGKK
jgi:hypothetical protein